MTYIPETKAIERQPFAYDAGFKARFHGASGSIAANTTGSIDLLLTEERAINGLQLILNGHETGDKCSFQVIYDGQVVNEFGTDWYVAGDSDSQHPIVLPIKASLVPTMTLRISYTSTGTSDVAVFVNYHLYEISS